MVAAKPLRATSGARGRAVGPLSVAVTILLAVTGCVASKPAQVAAPQPAASSSAATSSGASSAQSAHIAALEQQLRQAESLLRDSNRSGAEGILNAVIGDHDFGALPPQYQHLALRAAAYIASQERQLDRAQELIKRSCDTVGADQYDWILRFDIAGARRDEPDLIHSLTRLAQGWPQALSRLTQQAIQGTASLARSKPDQQLALLKALFVANYVPYTGIEPSALWRDLALLQLQHGDEAGAIAAAERITDPWSLLSLVVDNRFTAVRAKLPSLTHFDAAKARDEQIGRWRMAVEHNPDKLLPMVELTELLCDSNQCDEALQRTDEIIARIRAESAGTDIYKDQKQQYVWILDRRSGALYGLSRPEDAVQQMEEASRLPESGQTNVSQTINLAGLYIELGHPENARAALKRLDPNLASPFGRMQYQLASLRAALQLSDTAEINRTLAYLQQHQTDAVSAYQVALLESGRKEQARTLLLSRLQDPKQRRDALLAVQSYTPAPQPQRVQERRALLRSLIESPAVQEAIGKVGTIEQVDIDGPPNY